VQKAASIKILQQLNPYRERLSDPVKKLFLVDATSFFLHH